MTDVDLLKALRLTKESPLSEQIVQTTHHWMKACEENAELKEIIKEFLSYYHSNNYPYQMLEILRKAAIFVKE